MFLNKDVLYIFFKMKLIFRCMCVCIWIIDYRRMLINDNIDILYNLFILEVQIIDVYMFIFNIFYLVYSIYYYNYKYKYLCVYVIKTN